jgi:crossover junction endodeoxyribonuclease RuvC
MRILGIDPGCESTGYGIIESNGLEHQAILYGAIKTSSRQPFAQRLLKIHEELHALLGREPAGVMAIEQVFFATNVDSALKMAHARGVIMLVAAKNGLPVCEYSALEIKKGVVGYGRAEKEQVQSMVSFLLKLPSIPTPSDTADALAVAICHAHRMNAEAFAANAR